MRNKYVQMLPLLTSMLISTSIGYATPNAQTNQIKLTQATILPNHKSPTAKTQRTPPKGVVLNLQHADIRAVIQTIAKLTGKNFLVDPRVTGKITLVTNTPMSADEAYQAFLSMLQVLGFSAVPSGNLIKIVPNMNAKELGLPIATSVHPGKGDEIVTRVVQVKHVSATQLLPILRQMMPENASISVYSPNNTLILAGSASNISHLVQLIDEMDEDNGSQIQFMTLHHANAAKLVSVIQSLQNFDRQQGKNVNVSVVADSENNSVLISGDAADRLQMRLLVNRLDRSSTNANTTEVKHLNYTDAKTLAPILTKIAAASALRNATPGSPDASKTISIQADKTNNELIINAPAAIIQGINAVISQMDVRPQQVMVQAIIAQVNVSQSNSFGIQWGSSSDAVQPAPTDDGDDGDGTTPAPTQNQMVAGKVGIIPFGQTHISAILTALNQNDNDNILATPSVMVLNNQKAQMANGIKYQAQDNQYYPTSTDPSSTANLSPITTYTPTTAELKFEVTPQISPNNMVRMTIKQSDDELQNPANASSTNSITDTSSIQTHVMVHSGDILVLGGLIKKDKKQTVAKVPILGDIPLIGRLFQNKSSSNDNQMLLVFIRPVILDSKKTRAATTINKYNYARQQQMNFNAQEKGGSGPLLPAIGKPNVVRLPSPFTTK